MKLLRSFLDRIEPYFEHGGKLEKLYPVYEVIDTFFYPPADVTSGKVHVRDAIEFKRMMSTVMLALVPCIVMGMYNTGLQANLAINRLGIIDRPETIEQVTGWRGGLLQQVGLGFDSGSILDCLAHGALYFLPLYIVTLVVGVLWEMLFSVVRKHEINEGFFVTALLIPLIVPPSLPLWQIALATSFAVVIGKEIFGGTGRNFLNPALVARAFLFFAYAKGISGDVKVWTAGDWSGVDAFSGATPLGAAAIDGMGALKEQITLSDAFLGTIPGSMGETSVAACLIGAAILLISGVGSWRIMVSMAAGAVALAAVFCGLYGMSDVPAEMNPMFAMSPQWHLVLGGFAFGLVFMATDPVTAAMTNVGQFIYGLLIGALVILVRVVNPAFPEGTMLAILFGNTFAPLIDYYVVRANIKRRALRHA